MLTNEELETIRSRATATGVLVARPTLSELDAIISHAIEANALRSENAKLRQGHATLPKDHEAMNVLRRIDGLVVEWNRANGRWEVYQSATKRYHCATDPADALLEWRDKHMPKQKKGSK